MSGVDRDQPISFAWIAVRLAAEVAGARHRAAAALGDGGGDVPVGRGGARRRAQRDKTDRNGGEQSSHVVPPARPALSAATSNEYRLRSPAANNTRRDRRR